MKTTDHFWKVRFWKPERAQIQLKWIERVIDHPLHREVQTDERIRGWGRIPEFSERALRVVLLPDGETVLTAFVDGKFNQ